MKKLLLLFLCCINLTAFTQDIKRENVQGNIIVEGSEIEGITIYNSSSNLGTVTDENGEFVIAVALNDFLEIRALEYQNFDVRVNEAILESKKIHIFLIDQINKLEEVVVTTTRLTGNLKVDTEKAERFNPKQDAIYFGIKKKKLTGFQDDNKIKVRDIAMQSQPQTLVDGLNLINVVDQLLIPLFRSEVKDKKAAGVPEVPAKSIKYYLGSNFLVENFNIPAYRVEEFIRFVEDDKFDFKFLNYGHEIEFLELLSQKSDLFLKPKVTID